MLWLIKLLTDIPALVGKGFDFLNKKVDADVEKTRINRTSQRDVDVAVISNDTAGKQAQKELNLVGMNHPIWWAGWGLFVFPVGLYHASIFWVSTFPGLGWSINRVPPMQEQWAMYIVLSLFGAQVTTGVVSSIVSAWSRR